MAYETANLDMNLAAAVGDNPLLISELRTAFIEAAYKQHDLLCRARCDGNWLMAAQRLKGLAASFSVEKVMILADYAIKSAPGDPAILRKIKFQLDEMNAIIQ